MLRDAFRCSILLALSCCALLSCNEFLEPLPAAPGPVSTPPPSQFSIVGHWEAESSQGRRIAFDVTADGRIENGRVNLHHDCSSGRWRATFDGFAGVIVDDSFLIDHRWRSRDPGFNREGTVTISGRFEGDRRVTGGFINSVNDSRFNGQPTGEICPAIQASYDGERDP